MKFFTKFGFDVQSLSAATFFCTYELTKNVLKPRTSSTMFPFVHMCAATLGEVVSYHLLFNPSTPKISLVILLTVYCTVLVMLVWRIWFWIN